ncbi:hypothetical protein [Streptomyces anandii]|uniref:hypothetical protein n=1 Tax=Streptomyces anandii TaxID=285454 RepID=UPI003793BC11
MVALPAHITVRCPVCDQPIDLPLLVGPAQGTTVQLTVQHSDLRTHIEAQHPEVLTPRRPAPPPAASSVTVTGLTVQVRRSLRTEEDAALHRAARQNAAQALGRRL